MNRFTGKIRNAKRVVKNSSDSSLSLTVQGLHIGVAIDAEKTSNGDVIRVFKKRGHMNEDGYREHIMTIQDTAAGTKTTIAKRCIPFKFRAKSEGKYIYFDMEDLICGNVSGVDANHVELLF